ncbi:MAG: hypothetical protein RL338_1285 [Chloroflexota bacterium]
MGIPTGPPARREALPGLSEAEVGALRARYGENRLPSRDGTSAWTILVRQFASPLVYIILVAAGISLALGELGDFAIIALVIAVDVALGFFQEYQAHRAYLALRGLLTPVTTVIRDGRRREVEVRELVPGDLVVIATGDRAPADGDLVEATRLALDEAILTGESEPVAKVAATAPPGDREAARSRVFMGSTVVTGRGIVRVTATGTATELGRIAAGIADRDEEPTPLQVRLRAFSAALTRIVVVATVAILLVGVTAGREPLEMLRTSIVLAIAVVPEGLIIAVTAILVLGTRRILARRGLVRRLLAVETLGSVTTICTDKTGTLTEGRMRVSRSDLVDEERAWQVTVLCNDLEGPVDVALWEDAEQRRPGEPQALFDASERLAEELFTSETKYMIAAVTSTKLAGSRHCFLKGAPEIVLGMCDVEPAERERLEGLIDRWARDGLRLLGLAHRSGGSLERLAGYRWVGLVGMEDPVRDGVPEAVASAHRAGIRVVMITGDYPATAASIARAIGIPLDAPIVEGAEVERIGPDALRELVRTTTVFARIRPADKLRIVRALEANGETTAMIGDGVNDAPALVHANIGVVVGSASDVARETADLVLLDSSFRTIVAAVEEGRTIFDNIRSVVAYVLSNSFAEVLTILGAMLLGWPAPLLVGQILWIHLICDGPEDLVLAFEPAAEGTMARPPRPRSEPILDRLGATLIGVISVTSALYGLAVFGAYHLGSGDQMTGRSIVFASFASSSAIYILAYRSMRTPLLRMRPLGENKPLVGAIALGVAMTVVAFVVPPLRETLGLVPLEPLEWALVASFAVALLLVVELAKAVARRRAGDGASG